MHVFFTFCTQIFRDLALFIDINDPKFPFIVIRPFGLLKNATIFSDYFRRVTYSTIYYDRLPYTQYRH